MKNLWFISSVVFEICSSPAGAVPTVVGGYVNDAASPHRVGPGPLGSDSPSFADDFEIANNTALHPITIPASGVVTFTSLGFAAGGIDPYLTLFFAIRT
jgi:hypothetical protein